MSEKEIATSGMEEELKTLEMIADTYGIQVNVSAHVESVCEGTVKALLVTAVRESGTFHTIREKVQGAKGVSGG